MSGVEILDNGTHVLTAPRAAFGTDALLLGRFAQPRRAERALDLCSGCGIISLLWHDAGHRGFCTALELDPDASALCVQAVAENGDVSGELGDVLFAAVKVGRFCGVDPEEAITLTCEKFIRRFRAMERSALAQGREPDTLTLDEMTVLWNEAKRS